MLLADGITVKIIDVGAAQNLNGNDGVKLCSLLNKMNSLAMAPETKGTGRLSRKTDVYGFGTFLHAMLCFSFTYHCDISEHIGQGKALNIEDLPGWIQMFLKHEYKTWVADKGSYMEPNILLPDH
eukprot:141256_1